MTSPGRSNGRGQNATDAETTPATCASRNGCDWGGCAVGGLDAAARYAAFWFDPATGRRFPLADVTGSERFVTPTVPSPQDWVLVLRRW